MGLPRNFYHPFDITYRKVTEHIVTHSASIPDANTRAWLGTLVRGFWHEREMWPTNPLETALPGYHEYMTLASHLRWRMLWLTACAYLHIAYDLPRVLADEWPGTGKWVGGPDQNEAQADYVRLRPIFSAVLRRLRRWPSVFGSAAFIAVFVPGGAIGILSRWTTDLRSSAWMHAERLAAPGAKRVYIESKMMQAMIAALAHVQNNRPWSVDFLEPPDAAVFGAYAGLSALTTGQALNTLIVLNFVIFLANAVLIWSSFQRERFRDILEFIDEFGWRTALYVGEASRNPEGLDSFLRAMGAPQVKFPRRE